MPLGIIWFQTLTCRSVSRGCDISRHSRAAYRFHEERWVRNGVNGIWNWCHFRNVSCICVKLYWEVSLRWRGWTLKSVFNGCQVRHLSMLTGVFKNIYQLPVHNFYIFFHLAFAIAVCRTQNVIWIFFNKSTHIFTSSVLLFPIYSAQRICVTVKCSFFLLSFSILFPVKYCRLVELSVVENLRHFCFAAENIRLIHRGQDKGRSFSNADIIWFGGSSSDFSDFIHSLPKQGCKNELEWSGSALGFTCASYPLRAVVSSNKSGGLEYLILYHQEYTHINFF